MSHSSSSDFSSCNTMQYTTGILHLVGRLPLDRTLDAEVKDFHRRLDQTSSSVLDQVNDPEEQWSPDLSFINEGIVPEDMEIFLKYALPDAFTHPARGAYESPAHYLECWYRTMHEDFFGPLRKAIIEYRSRKLFEEDGKQVPRLDDGYLYHIKEVKRREKYQQYYRYLITFDRTKLKHVDWTQTDRLRGGSLLVLSGDRFETARFATVFNNHEEKVPPGLVWVQMIGGPLKLRQNFDAIESMNYFEPYYHVLQRLRVLAAKIDKGVSLPLTGYLVDGKTKVESPAYQSSNAILKLPDDKTTTAKQLKLDHLSLDHSQRKALQLALSHEFALIQGPPGTGKSYLGALFVKILMLNKDLWQRHNHGCIMLMAYKNHAIDQFINDCERMGIDMSGTIRLGGRGDSSVEKYMLRNKRQELSNYREYKHVNYLLYTLYTQLEGIQRTIGLYQAIVESKHPQFWTYRNYIPPSILYQLSNWVSGEPNAAVVMQWLDVTEENPDMLRIELMPVPTYFEVGDIYRRYANNIFQMPLVHRHQLYVFWRELAFSEAQECLAVYRERKAVLKENLDELRRDQDIATAHRADIIAMTTSGACIYSHIVEAVRPTIVLVEEAAEVLESHIVAPLTEGCKHVVLIGDHQQLRPSISNINMERRNLHISLFERLINNDISSQRLQIQHRMHPQISDILVPHIYSSLDNHQVVYEYPEVVGMKRRIHFIEHEHLEEKVGEKTSCRNHFEAEYIAALCHYLLQQGYRPSDITILATYMGQKRLISEKIDEYCARFPEPVYTEAERDELQRNLDIEFKDYLAQMFKMEMLERTGERTFTLTDVMRKKGQQYEKRCMDVAAASSKIRDVRVTTVDNYQGEECTIILLSFVRSNAAGNIGFLKWANRTCVALSRARHGFYAIGNFKLFAQNKKTNLWKNLCTQMKLKAEPIMSDTLELKCENHGKVTSLKDPTMFHIVAPDGGCQLDCDVRLECGHQCRKKCHAHDANHENYVCRVPCQGILSCDHPCGKICHEKGDDQSFFLAGKYDGTGRLYRDCKQCKKKLDCTVIVQAQPKNCEHIGYTCECSFVEAYRCPEKVMYELLCKHKKKAVCGTDLSTLTCYEMVLYDLPCDHQQKERCGTALSSIKCRTEVEVYSPCNEHRVRKTCSEETPPCVVTVQDVLPCSHTVQKLCHVDKSTIKCLAPDTVVLPQCRHEYNITCYERKEVESRVDTIQCLKMVNVELPKCKHAYPIKCHEKEEIESKIDTVKCRRPISLKLPNCDHPHRIVCHEREEVESKIGDVLCLKPILLQLPKCDHPFHIDHCYARKDPESVQCPRPVIATLPKCEHSYSTKCHKKDDIESGIDPVLCLEQVTATLPNCGHLYPSKCHERDDIESGKYPVLCLEKTIATLPKCGHSHETKCHEKDDIESGIDPVVCLEQVTATLPKCRHRYPTECHEKDDIESGIDRVRCLESMNATLPKCRHPYATKCHQKDDIESGRDEVKCAGVVIITLPCGHQKTVMCWEKDMGPECGLIISRKLKRCEHRAKILCGAPDPPCDKQVSKTLTCGHLTKVPCADPGRPTEPCTVKTTRKLDCGHETTFPCSAPVCNTMIKKKLPCRHTVQRTCSDIQKNPSVLCMETVKEKGECGHKISRKCSQKTGLCREKRTGRRECGHAIEAKCKDFDRLQVAECEAKVSVFRYCGHKVDVCCHDRENREHLKPCKEMCLLTCRHRLRCKGTCDTKCQRCIKPCLNKCPHSKCTKLCNEECNRNACNEPCPEGLLCGHDCTGFCGETCPQVCPECRRNLPKGRRVRLSCNHDIMAEQLDAQMYVAENDHVQEVVVKFCPLPHCGAVIQQCPRYANQIRRYLLLMRDPGFCTEGLSWWYRKRDARFFSTAEGESLVSVSAVALTEKGSPLVSYYSTDMDRNTRYRYGADEDWMAGLTGNAIYRQIGARRRDAFNMDKLLDDLPSLEPLDYGRENKGMHFLMDSDSDDNFYGNQLEDEI